MQKLILFAFAFLFLIPAPLVTGTPDNEDGKMPPMPGSRFFSPGKICAQGKIQGTIAWAKLSERKDGQLPTTHRIDPPLKCAEYILLIHNIEDIPINVMPSNIRLILQNGSMLKPFLGEKWSDDFVWLAPRIIELNGEDVSTRKLGSVTLRNADFVVMEVAFEMHPEDNPGSAIEKTEGFQIPVVFVGKVEEILNLRK